MNLRIEANDDTGHWDLFSEDDGGWVASVSSLSYAETIVAAVAQMLENARGEHCPDEGCPGVIEDDGECSHCGSDYQEKEAQ